MIYRGEFCAINESTAGFVGWKSGIALGTTFCGLNAYIVSCKIDTATAKGETAAAKVMASWSH